MEDQETDGKLYTREELERHVVEALLEVQAEPKWIYAYRIVGRFWGKDTSGLTYGEDVSLEWQVAVDEYNFMFCEFDYDIRVDIQGNLFIEKPTPYEIENDLDAATRDYIERWKVELNTPELSLPDPPCPKKFSEAELLRIVHDQDVQPVVKYACLKTGLLLDEKSILTASKAELEVWRDAVHEYDLKLMIESDWSRSKANKSSAAMDTELGR